MNEFVIDDEYRLERKSPERNIWNVFRHDSLIEFPKTLYKFYPLSILSIDSLYRSYFHLANPETFNDPFDCNINLLENIEVPENIQTVKRNNLKNVGVCCFTETINNHLMWAHYTNNYNGFAVEFNDIKIDNRNCEQVAIAPVIYPVKPKRVNTNHPYSHQYFLTTKLKHWDYEKEWRIVSHLKSSNREMPFTPSTVLGVYIGHKVEDNNGGLFNLLINLLEEKYPEASVYVVSPHPTELKLDFKKLKKKTDKIDAQDAGGNDKTTEQAVNRLTKKITEEIQKAYLEQMGIQHYQMTDAIVELLKQLSEKERELFVNAKLNNCKHYFDPILERIKKGEL